MKLIENQTGKVYEEFEQDWENETFEVKETDGKKRILHYANVKSVQDDSSLRDELAKMKKEMAEMKKTQETAAKNAAKQKANEEGGKKS